LPPVKRLSAIPRFAFCFFFALAARGQDALFSSVALNQTIASQAARTPPPDQPHLGPVQFGVGAYAGTSYNDNINGAEINPEADVISQAGLNLNFSWQATDNSALQFGSSVGYLDYLKYTANSGLEISPNSALTYAVSLDEVVVTMFDQFSFSREVQTEPALANITSLPQYNNNIGLQTEWTPGKWTLMASYSHADNDSTHGNDYLNRSSENLTARAGWRFAESTQAGVEASDALTAYQVQTANNNQNLSVGGYLEWQLRPSIHLTLRGGPVFYEPDSPGASGASSSVGSYYVSVIATHQITDYLSHSLNIERSLQAGANQGSGYVEQLTANYSIDWRLTHHISIGAAVNYTDGQQPLEQFYNYYYIVIPYLLNEDYTQYGEGLHASWQCTDHLSATVNYSHTERTSNLDSRNNTDNTVGLQLNYQF
jgi:hypothetical protein